MGYCACPCRDCFDVAIDGLCLACEEAGCSAASDAECERDFEDDDWDAMCTERLAVEDQNQRIEKGGK